MQRIACRTIYFLEQEKKYLLSLIQPAEGGHLKYFIKLFIIFVINFEEY